MRRFRGLENIINGSCPVASKITMPLLASITGLNVGHASGNAVAYSLKTIPLTDVVESRGALGGGPRLFSRCYRQAGATAYCADRRGAARSVRRDYNSVLKTFCN